MSDTNSATTYLQTAFRCQTPAKIEGKMKTQGYVFDFAPDRTLKLVAEAIELNHKSGKTNSPEQKDAMRQFLNFCPILAAKGGTMKPYDVENMLSQLKKAIIERVSRNGFDDPKLYNDELLQLDELDITRFNELKKIIGKSNSERVNEIKINDLGMTDLQTQQAEEVERKKKQKQELSQEEKDALKKLKEAREQKKTAISILRAVSIRMPMLVYGANVSIRDDITLQKFIELIDEESWQEFMPAGLSKERFREFTKYYDEDVFKGVARSIRAKAFDCDDLLPTERIQAIAEIFSTFKNPDKETVLTPWNVVNIHLTKAFGGHDFSSGFIDKTGKPEWKSHNVDTSLWIKDDTKILDINSKSGLYPLLACYNIYSRQLIKSKKLEQKISKKIWSEALVNNIYVLCKSPMAKSIALRTLAGYSGAKTNIIYIKDLMNKLQQKDSFKDYNLKDELLEKFNLKDKNMKFTAIVGNPPYQQDTNNNRDTPVYNLFMEQAYRISDKVSLITPARFLFHAGQTSETWNEKMLNDEHLKVIYFEQKSAKIFPNTDIKGGVVITYRDVNKNFGAIGVFTAFTELNTILQRVLSKDFKSFSSLLFGNSSYKLTEEVYKDFPHFVDRVSSAEKNSIGSNIFDRFPEMFFEKKPDNKNDYIKILGRLENQRVIKWTMRKYVASHSNLDKWKVFVSGANGTGTLGETLSTPIVSDPLTGGTQTFISFGSFDHQLEALNLLKYLKTKFARALLATLKVTQNNKKKFVWKNVPLQDFTSRSDIDWLKSIPEIDKQLYTKYGLDKKEINFIETHVKSMK
ncbi:MAG: Eco57I restriction-modification methylase domain-containing protein [Candidatus Pacebacteria bacterium]|nr:Eco57I restriction-modification methylase domain-containing protein [Candidatus Paceibacterota bacterium]MDD4737718.1 Eco57I restriction-modification methylase domain-containing protein [Candidatus Paceibacterota bacterium]